MGLSLEGMLGSGSDNSLFGVTVMSNEDDGIVSYAAGRIQLTEGRFFIGPPQHSTRNTVGTMSGEDLVLLFSDRHAAGHAGQGFDVDQPEKLAFQITPGFGSGQPATIDLRVTTWSNHNVRFSASSLSDVLVGIGPPLSGKSAHSVFTFSFSQLPPSPH